MDINKILCIGFAIKKQEETKYFFVKNVRYDEHFGFLKKIPSFLYLCFLSQILNRFNIF